MDNLEKFFTCIQELKVYEYGIEVFGNLLKKIGQNHILEFQSSIVLPTRLRESDVFSFRRSLSRGLPEVALETLVDRNLQKSQNLSKTSSGNTLDKVGAVGSSKALKF